LGQTARKRGARPQEPWAHVTLGELRDCERFDEFVRSAYPRMLSLARQLAVSPEDAADAAQKAFLELHEVVTGRLAEPKAFAMGFMVERIRWRARDTLRDRQRQPGQLPEPDGPPDGDPRQGVRAEIPGSGPELAALLMALAKSEDLHRAGGELSGRRGEVFALLVRDQRPVDIARQLGITKARVSQLTRLLCVELRTKLVDRGWECHETIGVPLNSGPGAAL
jgi:RNA polymerase sigma factor (sigma-70 family)